MSLISVIANEAPSDMWNMPISRKITHLAYMTFNKTIKIINKNKTTLSFWLKIVLFKLEK